MVNCKNHKLVRTANPIKEILIKEPIELIQIYGLKFGDSNDVFENKDVRGTPSMIEEYAKDYFKPRYWKDLQDYSDSGAITFSLFESGNSENCYTVNCYPQGIEYSTWKPYVDLIHNEYRDKPKYIEVNA